MNESKQYELVTSTDVIRVSASCAEMALLEVQEAGQVVRSISEVRDAHG